MDSMNVLLTDEEKALMFEFSQKEQAGEVAQALGVSEHKVSQSIDDIVRKLQLGSLLAALSPEQPEPAEDTRELAAV